jgi:hypothetical protein
MWQVFWKMDQEEKVYEAIFQRSKTQNLAAAAEMNTRMNATNQSERKPLHAI